MRIIRSKAFSLAVALSLLALGCAGAKEETIRAVEKAEAQERILAEHKVPRQRTLDYQTKVHRARKALDDRKYGEAREAANAAIESAEKAINDYEAMVHDLYERNEKLWRIITYEPFPSPMVVQAAFKSSEAIAAEDYTKAEKLISDAEWKLQYQGDLVDRRVLQIQESVAWFKEHEFIPVYEKIEDGRLAGEVVGRITQPSSGKFIENYWIDAEHRHVKVLVVIEGAEVAGWVDEKFIY